MGNHHSNNNDHSSSGHHHHKHAHRKPSTANPAAIKTFEELAEGRDLLAETDFERVFGHKIGSLLWRNVFKDHATVKQEDFSRHYYDLMDIRSEDCTNMFGSIENFLDGCLSTFGKELKQENTDFVKDLVHDADKEGSTQFFSHNTPGLAQNTVIRHIKNVFCPSNEQIIFAVDSCILSPLQMLLVQGSLSEMVYFKHKQATQPCWTKLYESHSQGLSTNRFEANVFGYASPSVAIFKLTDGKVYCIANNVEWRHTTKFIGSSLSKCVQIAPHFKFIESRHEEPIMCNFKYRSAPFGVGFKDVFTVDGEFGNVEAIEAWGCGNATSIQDQKALKQRQKMAVERNQKVPLPGNWDDNPDKAVMEMAGFQFSNERNRPEPPHEE